MNTRMKIMVAVTAVLIVTILTVALFGQGNGIEKATSSVVQYKVVPIPNILTQEQLQTILTAQGNAGFRLLGPYAVGAGPIPDKQVLVFSKP